MNRRGNEERRESPRIGARLPIQLAGSDTDPLVTTESMNLSRGGVSCRTSEYVSPMAKVALTMILPPFGNLTKASRILRAEGIVVRCEPVPEEEREMEAPTEYDLACCFTSLDPESKNLLDAYVAWKILRSVHADEGRTAAAAAPARHLNGPPTRKRSARGSGDGRPSRSKGPKRGGSGRAATTKGSTRTRRASGDNPRRASRSGGSRAGTPRSRRGPRGSNRPHSRSSSPNRPRR